MFTRGEKTHRLVVEFGEKYPRVGIGDKSPPHREAIECRVGRIKGGTIIRGARRNMDPGHAFGIVDISGAEGERHGSQSIVRRRDQKVSRRAWAGLDDIPQSGLRLFT